MSTIRAMLIMALAVSAACTTTKEFTVEGDMVGESAHGLLEGDALRKLFADVYAAPVRSPDVQVSHPKGEIFRADGIYSRIVGRTSVEGIYEFEVTSFAFKALILAANAGKSFPTVTTLTCSLM